MTVLPPLLYNNCKLQFEGIKVGAGLIFGIQSGQHDGYRLPFGAGIRASECSMGNGATAHIVTTGTVMRAIYMCLPGELCPYC